MEGMQLVAGALLVGFGAVGGAVGVGVVGSKYLEGIARQPELQGYLLGQFFFYDGCRGRLANYFIGHRSFTDICLKKYKKTIWILITH